MTQLLSRKLKALSNFDLFLSTRVDNKKNCLAVLVPTSTYVARELREFEGEKIRRETTWMIIRPWMIRPWIVRPWMVRPCDALISVSHASSSHTLTVPWWLRHPPVGHCDTSTLTIRHYNDSPHVMPRPCDTTSAIRLNSVFFVQGVFVGA